MALEPNAQLGPYKVLNLIGAGGMGEVYKARDTRLNRTVAIKVLPPALAADPQFRERFDREARTISQVEHPNICALYDVGEHGGTAYLVMQYLEGETLAQRIAKGALPLGEGIRIATEIADALTKAHGAGVIHRDLKPGNVMLTSTGAKLLDFGIAKLFQTSLQNLADAQTIGQTEAGAVVGTTRYMSPEQARGTAVDSRSDLFSFGILFYEMLSGRVPFEGTTNADVLVRILEREPLPVTQYRPEVPAELQRITARCLEKDRDRRYASARDLIADLEKAKASITGQQSGVKLAPSIAVLPFVNMSTDPENEYFCDGIAEELINAFTKIEQLRVAARTSAFSFKGKTGDLREIGRTLNVSTVLEGSVRKAGNRLRVTAQLVNVADGYHLWSERYDRNLEDVFAIQDEISLAIVTALKVRLIGEEKAALAKRHTENVEAFQLYQQGRHHWHKWNEQGFLKSRECMERAIQIDPDYALAYCGLADSYLAGASGTIRYADILPRVKEVLARALDLDPGEALAWTLSAVACYYDWDFEGAERTAARAIELNPRLAQAHTAQALVYLYSGRPDRALAPAKRAVELDPLAPMFNRVLAETHVALGESDSAIRQIRLLLDISPNFWRAHWLLGTILPSRGESENAIASLEEAVRCSGGAPYAVGSLAGALGSAGHRDRAEREIDALLDRARSGYIPSLSFALAYMGLSMVDRVFEWLDRAFEERDLMLRIYFVYAPVFEVLRRDPRGIDLLRRLKAF